MRSFLLASFVMLAALSLTQIVRAEDQGPLKLEAPADVKLATELNNAMKKVSETITACAGKSKDAVACRCEHKAEVGAFNNKVKETLKKKPEWQTQSLLVTGKGGSFSLNMPGLAKMSQMDPCAGAK